MKKRSQPDKSSESLKDQLNVRISSMQMGRLKKAAGKMEQEVSDVVRLLIKRHLVQLEEWIDREYGENSSGQPN